MRILRTIVVASILMGSGSAFGGSAVAANTKAHECALSQSNILKEREVVAVEGVRPSTGVKVETFDVNAMELSFDKGAGVRYAYAPGLPQHFRQSRFSGKAADRDYEVPAGTLPGELPERAGYTLKIAAANGSALDRILAVYENTKAGRDPRSVIFVARKDMASREYKLEHAAESQCAVIALDVGLTLHGYTTSVGLVTSDHRNDTAYVNVADWYLFPPSRPKK